MKKILPVVIIAVVLTAAAAVYFFFLRGEPEIKYTTYSPGEFFVTNVKDSKKLLKTGIVMVLDTDTLEAKLTENNALIRDSIIFILRSLTDDVLAKADAQNTIRILIKDDLNQKLKIENIVDIYFNDFVVQ